MMKNLRKMLARADDVDRREGEMAYLRYNQVIRQMSDRYRIALSKVTAAFVSLSPNSDYVGNLRSTVSVLEAVAGGLSCGGVTVSTYNHCRDRAYDYATGRRDFLSETKGPKIINFYHNIVDPMDNRWVTIDGHMVAAWLDRPLIMKEAIVSKRQYDEIAAATKQLAFEEYYRPNQVQAIIWFARKRTLNVKYIPQLSLLHARDDQWRTVQNMEDIRPYPRKMPSPLPMGIG